MIALLSAGWAAPPVPRDLELPVKVAAAVTVNEVDALDESAETFHGIVDVTISWRDPGARFDPRAAGTDRRTFTGDDADAELAKVWTPGVEITNLVGEPDLRETTLRVFPDGRIEHTQRLRATFGTPVDLERFPFDHQDLAVELGSPVYNARQVRLVHTQADTERSGVSPRVALPEWEIDHRLRFRGDEVRGLDGMVHSELRSTLRIGRLARSFVASLFAPLAVILLLPVLCIWVRTDIHERINWVITAVFSLIALNFSVGIEYPALGVDSTFMRLFWYGYLAQGVALALIMVLFNEGALARWLGEDLVEEALRYLSWALPLVIVVAFGDVLLALAT